MSDLIVIVFEGSDQAGEAFQSLKSVQNAGQIGIDDAAVIVKDESGKVSVKNTLDTGVKYGALGGGILGLLLASIFFPLAGLLVGAGLGALVGKTFGKGVDQDFVKEVTDQLQPGNSALFVMVNAQHTGGVVAAMQPYKGSLYQTSLPTDVEDALRDALK
jgi:uncharacterized membrane protein